MRKPVCLLCPGQRRKYLTGGWDLGQTERPYRPVTPHETLIMSAPVTPQPGGDVREILRHSGAFRQPDHKHLHAA